MPIANLRSLANPRVPLQELNLNMLLNSPVLALPGQEGTGNILTDISGFEHDGTRDGATWVRLPSGLWVLSYDGINDKTSVSLRLDDFSDWTILLWLFCDTNHGASKSVWGQDSVSYTLWWNGASTLNLWWGASTLDFGDIVMEAYNHLAVVRKGNIWRALTNGVVDDTGVNANTIANATLYFGSGAVASAFSKGIQALIQVCPSALADQDILDIVNREKHYFDIFNGNVLARILKQRELAVVR